MALEKITTSPVINDFTPLSEHQEQTPASFFGGSKPVLHLHSPGAKIKITKDDLDTQSTIADLQAGTSELGEDGQISIENVDVWVSSTDLTLFSSAKSTGIQIPYQTITVHAQEGSAVYLGLNLSDNNTPDEDLVFIQLRIIPTSITSTQEPEVEAADAPRQPNGHSTEPPAQSLFKAISDCQELNPDPPEEGDEEFDETAPGATGWITSENMGDFLDENGELRIPQGATVIGAEDEEDQGESLGEGAGRTRTAAEVDGEDGVEDETKWQRTG
jgi:chloride channel, nucleotide-sensitive, 1A